MFAMGHRMATTTFSFNPLTNPMVVNTATGDA
jgi:hypothetical protein